MILVHGKLVKINIVWYINFIRVLLISLFMFFPYQWGLLERDKNKRYTNLENMLQIHWLGYLPTFFNYFEIYHLKEIKFSNVGSTILNWCKWISEIDNAHFDRSRVNGPWSRVLYVLLVHINKKNKNKKNLILYYVNGNNNIHDIID